MLEADNSTQENQDLLLQLSRLSDASLRITSSLELGTILQATIDSARLLTDAQYGALLTFDDRGNVQDFFTSGITPEERQRVGELPKAVGLLGHLRERRKPLRLRNLASHTTTVGLPENHPPMKTFLGMPIRRGDQVFGSIYLTEKSEGREFTLEDENIIAMFATQTAMAVSNALKYGAERRAKSDLEALLNSSPVGVLVFDAKTGAVLSLNEATRRMVAGLCGKGGSLEHILNGMTFRRADGREFCLAEFPLARVLRSGETVRAEEIVISLPDGRAVTTLVSARPFYSDEGEIVSVVVTMQFAKPVREPKQLGTEFLSVMTNELWMPLTTIKGSTTSVLDSPSPLNSAETRQFFRIIDEQADHIRDFISNLLDLTRIESGTFSISRESTDVVDVVVEAKNAFLRGGAKNHVVVERQPDLPPVMADTQRILQVLNNLLCNASKCSPEASTIRLTVSHVDDHVAITVSDEGRGISAERLPHLFEKSSWIDSEEEKGAGLSLALAVCKGIVEAHGGNILAESPGPDLGTQFTITIPVTREELTVAGVSAPQPSLSVAQADSMQVRILAVLNDLQIQSYVRDTLSGVGYLPIVTGNPDEVSHLINENKPSLILLDLGLAGNFGFEVMKSITRITDAPIIFLSEYRRDHTISEAFQLGAADYIAKPFSPAELIVRISTALQRKSVFDRTQILEPYILGDLEISYMERTVKVAGYPVRLTATEYNLLFELSVNAGRVVTQGQLLERVWGVKGLNKTQVLRAFVKAVRRKLNDDAKNPKYIFTEHRVGYRMAKPNS